MDAFAGADLGRAVALMHIEIHNQDPFHLAIGEQHKRSDRHIVEGAETLHPDPGVRDAAPGRVAGDAARKRQPRRHHRARGRQPRAPAHPFIHRKPDLPFDGGNGTRLAIT
jgi:hypothetical protein